MKPNLWDAYDSFDRQAIQSAEMIRQLADDVLDLYKAGVELNDPSPGTIKYDQPSRNNELGDPTGNMATNPRRHLRTQQLRAARLALDESLRDIRQALYNAAAAASP